MPLKFIAISGTTGVTENLYLYEYGNDLIVVDCGVGFPEPEMYGVDLIIPDFTYIVKNKNKLRGILISHGHEDHLGALPFLLKEVNAPIFTTKLVAGFIEDKLRDYNIKKVKINIFDPDGDEISLGVFQITPFRVSHSVPDGVGFAIDTPEGKIFHIADYKFDWTPVDNRPFDINKASVLALDGCLALASDCLGATTSGYTESEREIEKIIEDIVKEVSGQVFFTTISSNISRIKQALNVAEKLGRNACFIGRSIDSKAKIARNLGYLDYSRSLVVDSKQTGRMAKNKMMYIISGSYGQPGSALYKLALAEHDYLSLQPDDAVIFSSDPAPPGSKANVDFVVDKLIEQNVNVHYYDVQENLHVSGHGSQKDIEMLFGLLSPKHAIPIGGTVRHMRAYKLLAEKMGLSENRVFELNPGEIIEFQNGNGRKTGKIPVRNVLVDGLGIGDVGNVVLRDRQVLAKDGIAIVVLQLDRVNRRLISAPEIISRGFVFGAKTKNLLIEASKRLKNNLERKNRVDKHIARNTTIDFLEKHFFEETGRRPMVLPVIIEV